MAASQLITTSKAILLVLTIGSVLLLWMFYQSKPVVLHSPIIWDQQELNLERKLEERITDTANKTLTIIFLNGHSNVGLATSKYAKEFERHSHSDCGGYSCRVRASNSLNPEDSDLAVFYSIGLNNYPPKRNPEQLWVFATGESQRSLATTKPELWDGLFNYSMTFERTSKDAIQCGFSFAKPFQRKDKFLKIDFAKKKRQILTNETNALWFVSNCHPSGIFKVQSGRMEYSLELSKYIHIDAYTRRAPCKSKLKTLYRDKSKGEPDYRDYWFYLSFENSLCRDYITEKFWKILLSNSLVIPVVMGGTSMEDYERIAPPNSYIHVKNFSSPQELARHLNYVVENDEAFNYYHQWRNEYIFTKNSSSCKSTNYLCHLCKLAHERPKKVWRTFSRDFTKSDCIDVSTNEGRCKHYNISCKL